MENTPVNRRLFTIRTALALAALVALPLAAPTASADAPLKVVTSTTDLYDIAKAVGGN